MKRVMFLGALVASLVSCMSRPEPFAPTEHATAVTRKGQRVAEYEVIAGGRVAGETKVWSTGAFEEKEPDDRERTLLHVAFMLESTDQEPIQLEVDNVALDSVDAGGKAFSIAHPKYVEEKKDAADKETEVHMYFEMPKGLEPQNLDAFRVRWSVKTPEGRYEQRTPFLESELPPNYYYYYPYYDPWYWHVDPWGY